MPNLVPKSRFKQVLWSELKEGDEIFIIDAASRNSDYLSGPHKVINKDMRTLAEYGNGAIFITFTNLLYQERKEE